MGVTGAIFKGLTFDGEDSKDYGVYITGQAVYNSPERDVEMISIPGRDGAFALDRGRFSNIEVTYPAGLFGVDEADFAQAIADFRNMLGSRVGYCRLEDDYNPGEYREAVFKAGLEVTPASLESGQFDIVFECKPQRWLTSGEDAVAVTSGDDITNPTLFDARPMLQVWGYGDIDLGGQEISIGNVPLGTVLLANGEHNASASNFTFSEAQVNTADAITLTDGSVLTWGAVNIDPDEQGWQLVRFKNVVVTSDPGMVVKDVAPGAGYSLNIILTPIGYVAGTAKTSTFIVEGTMEVEDGGTTVNANFGVQFNVAYTSASSQGILSVSYTYTTTPGLPFIFDSYTMHKFSSVYGMSTKPSVGSPAYIDLDIGEAYCIVNDEPISINNAVTIPAVLPTLPPGATSITYDNTITQFKVVPRWWQL